MDHLSKLEESKFHVKDAFIKTFHDEIIWYISNNLPYYADIVNYLVAKFISKDIDSYAKEKLIVEFKKYIFDDPYLYQLCLNGMLRTCIPRESIGTILEECRMRSVGGHYWFTEIAAKISNPVIIGLIFLLTLMLMSIDVIAIKGQEI